MRKVARLARLDPDDARVESLRAELSAVIGYVARVRAVDAAGVEPLVHVSDEPAHLAEDAPGPTLPEGSAAAMAPESFGPYVKVPKVLGDEGGGA